MKKLMIMMLMLGLCAPAFAGDDCKGDCPHKKTRREMKEDRGGQREEMRKIRKERDEQFKKTKEQVEKLVKEYKKAKPGSKKAEAKKAEIAKLVTNVREDQFKFKRKMLDNFRNRLNVMESELAAAEEPAAKTAWVNEKTDAVIKDDGDLKVLFHDKLLPPPPGPKGRFKKGGPRDGRKDHHMRGARGMKGVPPGPVQQQDGEQLPPPPPADAL